AIGSVALGRSLLGADGRRVAGVVADTAAAGVDVRLHHGDIQAVVLVWGAVVDAGTVVALVATVPHVDVGHVKPFGPRRSFYSGPQYTLTLAVTLTKSDRPQFQHSVGSVRSVLPST